MATQKQIKAEKQMMAEAIAKKYGSSAKQILRDFTYYSILKTFQSL